jgi:aryl-alcohol dehydrogenase-like predicted oxidoreductase
MPDKWTGQNFNGVIETCKRHDMAIMNIRIFASGALATDVRHGREVQLSADADLDTEKRRSAAVRKALGDRHGTRAQAAVRFGLANPDVSCVVIGLAELSHLEEAVAAQATGPLPEEAIRQLDAVYSSNFN